MDNISVYLFNIIMIKQRHSMPFRQQPVAFTHFAIATAWFPCPSEQNGQIIIKLNENLNMFLPNVLTKTISIRILWISLPLFHKHLVIIILLLFVCEYVCVRPLKQRVRLVI